MGRIPREQPARLAEKLAYVRRAMNLSQDDMVRRLGLEGCLAREEISKYERGLRTPSLLTLLKYAQEAGLVVDDLIDDRVDLPGRITTTPKAKTRAASVKRSSSKRSR